RDRLADWQLLVDQRETGADLRLGPGGLVRAKDQVLLLGLEQLGEGRGDVRREIQQVRLGAVQLSHETREARADDALLADDILQRDQVRVEEVERVALA